MKMLVCYDVAKNEGGEKRLREVAKTCKNYGVRVQYSVFECVVEPAQLITLQAQLLACIDERYDSLRYYYLGKNWQNRVEHVGAKVALDVENDVLLF